jgi:hypothetical protein
MNPRSVQEGLQELGRAFAPVLHDSAYDVLEEATARLSTFIRGRDRKARKNWGYNIPPTAPLRFKPTLVDELGYTVWVDVYCAVEWLKEDTLPDKQDIKIRVWSKEEAFLHRFERAAFDENSLEELDPTIREVFDKMGDPDPVSGRVIYRCHLDKANDKQMGPRYHIQFGGEPASDEHCWLPDPIISLPRFVHSPHDLILTCELVASNFYLKEYEEIKKDPTWMSVLKHSQLNQLLAYYRECFDVLDNPHREGNGSLLLDHLWNL